MIFENLYKDAHDRALRLLGFAAEFSSEEEGAVLTSIALCNLSAAFSAIAFVATKQHDEGQEIDFADHFDYSRAINAYESVEQLLKVGDWVTLTEVCDREQLRIISGPIKFLEQRAGP